MIYLDPGHGGSDSGAQYQKGEFIDEKTINFAVANRVAQTINLPAVLDRTYDETRSLEDRVERANDLDASIYFSIHCNWFYREDPSGFEAWHYPTSLGGEQLADKVIEYFQETTPLDSRGVKPADDEVDSDREPYLYVLEKTKMTAVLLEIGFLSNPEDRDYLTSDDGLLEASRAIKVAIERFVAA